MSDAVGITVLGINWALLHAQKASLCYAITEAVEEGNKNRAESFTGLLHMIDAIQDAAVEDKLATEAEVFPKGREVKKPKRQPVWREVLRRVKMLREDMCMLKRGDWVPDDDSCQASIDNCDRLIQIAKGGR